MNDLLDGRNTCVRKCVELIPVAVGRRLNNNANTQRTILVKDSEVTQIKAIGRRCRRNKDTYR